ncbi:MAG: linear amide C-N hydrolase [Candidatus Aegiribacteria sp.]|nr:linear amide C-N hydrolase [Candidatus Aegiribacteria sp.]
MTYILAALFCLTSIAGACTGYAVYADETWFGMNFDYPPESEIRFSVHEWDIGVVFDMSFYDCDLDIWIPAVAMNEHGMFSSLQYQCPMIEGEPDPEHDERCIWELFITSINDCTSLEQVEAFIDTVKLVNMYELTLHTLIADTSGRAIIAEAGIDENLITNIEGDWIVMTNFKIADTREISIGKIEGVGADRYRNALAFIEDNFDGFILDDAVGTLEAAVNTDEIWSTKASTIYDPSNRTVYICIDGDFNHVWKVSMNARTIETFSGFDSDRSMQLDENGITVKDLRLWL